MTKEQAEPVPWTPEDDLKLRSSLEEGGGRISWTEIARRAFPDGEHDKADCTERWRSLQKPKGSRGPWTKEEDTQLQALVAQYGSEKWVVIAADMKSRSGKQCRERWHNHLDPTINKGEWTPEEERLIHSMYAKIGSRWAEMAKHLPGRPDNAIKNFFNASLIRQKRKRGDSISSLAANLDLGGGEMSAAPSMSRSASSNSLSGSTQRFTPYVRSSPMTKSRSESISSLAAFSPLRGASIEQFAPSGANSPGAFPTGYYSPATTGMTRSQSSISTYSPPTPMHQRVQGVPPPPPHVVSRDLTKAMLESGATYTTTDEHGYPIQVQTLVPMRGDTPPATPDRPPYRHQHSASSPAIPAGDYSSYNASHPSPPPMATTSAFYSGTSIHPEFESGPSWCDEQPMEGYTDANGTVGYETSFSHLHINDPMGQMAYPADQYAQEQPHPQYAYPEPHIYSPPLTGHMQSASEPMYQTVSYGTPTLGHSASVESIQPHALYGGGGGQPYVHPSHLVSLEQAQYEAVLAPTQLDEWGNIVQAAPSANGLSNSYSSHSLNYSQQPSPIDAASPGSDYYSHPTRSSNSSTASSPYHPYSPTVEDVPEEPRKPIMPRRGSVPVYPSFAPQPAGAPSIYASTQQMHQPAYTASASMSDLKSSSHSLSHSLSTPAALSSIPSSASSPTPSKPSKPPLSSSSSYHSSTRRISRPSSLSLSSTLDPPIDLSTPLASPSLYRPSMEQDQATPRSRPAATGMTRGYSSPGGESLGQGAFGGGGGLRIRTDFAAGGGGGGGGGGGTGMVRYATVGGGLGSTGMVASAGWEGSRSGSVGIGSPGLGGGAGKAHPTSDLMGVDQHGRACLPGIAG